jgi:hypothetical protein
MDSVADERSRLRQHVRAAREWLGRAEDSLDRAEDVRGDLNLMLAQAELMRAKETERPSMSVVWARRVAPLCAAALLAGAGLWVWRAGVPPAQEIPLGERRIEQRTETATAGIAEASRKETTPLPIVPQEEIVPAESPAEAEPLVMEMERQESEPAMVPQEAEMPPDAPAAQEMRIPSEDMQRLMSSAGQSLRAIHTDSK